MRIYLKQKMADALLCMVLTVSLVPVICSGFVLTDPWSRSMTVIVVCSAVLQLLFTLLARSRVTIWLGVTAGAVIAAALFGYMRMTNPLTDETANSTFIFALIQVITALLVFLLSRSRPGVAVLFLTGTLICAGCHFLQYPAPTWCLYSFLAAVAVLFLHRVCAVSLAKAELGSVPTFRHLGQTVLLCACSMALALGICLGVLVPLKLPTQELKLITQLRSMELLQVLGVSSTEVILDSNLASDAPPEETEQSGESGEEDSEALEEYDETQSGETPDLRETLQESISTAIQQAAFAIRYDSATTSRLWLLLLIPAAVIAAYVLRYCRRRRWNTKVQSLDKEDAVVNYYRFFLSRLGRVGLKKRPEHTLREFSSGSKTQLAPFEGNGVRFEQLTEIYEKVLYGHHQVSNEEYNCFLRFYESFYSALRRETGALKYYLCAFRY